MRESLMQLYHDLYARYGHQYWWPAETPFEVVIGAILVQGTAWGNVVKAIDNLKRKELLTPERLGEAPPEQLEPLIRPAGYYRAKAKKVHAFMTHLWERHRGCLSLLFAQDAGALRAELLSIYGVGEETADSIILYAAEKPVFVVDQYTYRLLTRLGWFNGGYHYGRLQRIFMETLPHEVALFNEYHALIVRHCAMTCRKTPKCGACILQTRCLYSQASAGIQVCSSANHRRYFDWGQEPGAGG
jgi:endonuclease-3 related protein